MTFAQKRNDIVMTTDLVQKEATGGAALSAEAQRDLLLGAITLKYTQVRSLF